MLAFRRRTGKAVDQNPRSRRRSQARRLAQDVQISTVEVLEDRTLLSSFTVEQLSGLSVTGTTEHKPQSKVWEHNNTWFAAMNRSDGMRISRLDGTTWTHLFFISGENGRADVKSVGDTAYVLIQNGSNTKLATLQYQSGSPGTYQLTGLSDVPVPSNIEVVTIDIDTTGRMWAAFDSNGKIQVIHSAAPYTSWSSPITLATGVKSDDIAVVVALPNQKAIGVLWSDQNSQRFGFRLHADGASPTSWSADEVPASQSAMDIRGGMADDHLNVAVAPDGTLFAAVKTSYNTSGVPLVGLLVRRPNGTWDDLHHVDDVGTRPIVVLNEARGRIVVLYDDGPVLYRESSASSISFGPVQTLMSSGSNVTSSKANWTDDLVVVAGKTSVRLVATDGGGGGGGGGGETENSAPALSSIGNKSVQAGKNLSFTVSATDADGDPLVFSASNLPTGATFDPNTRKFSWTPTLDQVGSYQVTFSVTDGQASDSETITITVTQPKGKGGGGGNGGGGKGGKGPKSSTSGLLADKSELDSSSDLTVATFGTTEESDAEATDAAMLSLAEWIDSV